MTTTAIDHIVFGAAELDAGKAWMTDALGAEPVAAGRHALMSTHNALWRLGNVYLEVITIDPDAPQPDHKRWYGLDDPAVAAVLEQGPTLLTWVIEPENMALARAHMPTDPGPALSVSRDALSWQLTVPGDGLLCMGGAQPTLISWDAGSLSPRQTLPEQSLRLKEIQLPSDSGLQSALSRLGLSARIGTGPFGVTLENARGESCHFESRV